MSDQIPSETATVIRPGDHVLLTTRDDLAPEIADDMREKLSERFPGVEFTFVADITSAAVERSR